MYQDIIFADFDGTITMEDTLAGAIKLYADPDVFREYTQKLVKGEMTLSQVVRFAFDGAPAQWLEGMLQYVDQVPIRPGFDAFLDEMQQLGIPVVVISGGLRQFSERKLAPYMDRIAALHAVDLDLIDGHMQLRSGYDDGNELLKKTDVMALYEYKHAYGIGDSFTDMNMAQAVDTIFARDVLAQFLQKKGMAYLPYEDFDAVTKAIKQRSGTE